MSAARDPGSSAALVRDSATAGPVPLAEVVNEVARQAITLPLDYRDAVPDLAALLLGDPRNQAQLAAVAEAIIASALADPFWETTANQWRPMIPDWVRARSMSGATVRILVRLGVLVPTGRHARCDDTSSRNGGKFQPIYALDLTALRERLRADPAEQPLPGAPGPDTHK